MLAIGQKNAKNVVRSVCKYERGNLKKYEVLCFDENGVNVIGNAFRMFEEFSFDGKIASAIKLFQDGSMKKWIYNANENCVRVECVSSAGCLGDDGNGVSFINISYDAGNREISREYYNSLSNRVISTFENISGCTNQYDVANRKMVQIFVDDKNRPCPNKNNDGLVKTEVALNEDMLCESIRYYGTSNVFLKGFAYKYDRMDRKVADTNINECLEPIEVGGVAYTTIKYDDLIDGKKEEYRFYDIKNVPCISSQGCVGYVKEFDKFGNEIKLICIDENGSRTNNTMGWSMRCHEWDSYGRPIRQYYLNKDGAPFAYEDKEISLLTKKKIIEFRVSYNGDLCFGDAVLEGKDKKLRAIRHIHSGLLLGVMWMNMNDLVVEGEQGWACCNYEYNSRGEMTCVMWTDEKGTPKSSPSFNCAMMRCVYTHSLQGVRVAIQYLDEERYPTDCFAGVASLYLEYDKNGNLREAYAKNKLGQPISFGGDCDAEKIKYDYDLKNRLTEVSFFMQNGDVYELGEKKIVKLIIEYDKDDNVINCYGYNKEGKKIISEKNKNEILEVVRRLKDFIFVYRYRKNYLELEKELQNQSFVNIPYNAVSVSSLMNGGQAEKIGLKVGDILLQMNDWRVIDFANIAKTNSGRAFSCFTNIIHNSTNTVRTLDVSRKISNQQWKRMRFKFDVGMYGFVFGPVVLSDKDFKLINKVK